MNFGLKTEHVELIIEYIKKFSEIEKACIFGSRAKGNYKNGSDVDLAIYGEQINFELVSNLHYLLNDDEENKNFMPYFFDVVDYTHNTNINLKSEIDEYGVCIYKKK